MPDHRRSVKARAVRDRLRRLAALTDLWRPGSLLPSDHGPHVSAVAPVSTQTWRPERSVARTSAILLAQVLCETPAMARPRKPHRQNLAAGDALPDDLYDYARPSTPRATRPVAEDPTTWTVKDDWPEEVPVTEAEIEVFEAWFGDLFDELFSTRH